ncbi:MAG: RDD family protein [Thermomicrobiales bacterium]
MTSGPLISSDVSLGTMRYPDFTPFSEVDATMSTELPSDCAARTTDVVGRRFAAITIDLMISYVALTVILGFFQGWSDRSNALGYLSVVGVSISKVLFEALLRGATPGKKLLKIEVIKESGEPIGFTEALLRNLLLAPGVVLLWVPSILMMTFSQKRQRLGDMMAGTLVVRVPATGPQLSANERHLTCAPNELQGTPMVIGHRRSLDFRALAVGGTLASVCYLAAIAFTTAQTLTENREGACCFPEVRSASWIHTDMGIALSLVLMLLSFVVVPVGVGFSTRSFAWIPIFGGLTFVLLIPAWIIGVMIAKRFFSGILTEDVSGASIFLMLGLIVVPVVAVIPAAVGTIAGRAIQCERNQRLEAAEDEDGRDVPFPTF